MRYLSGLQVALAAAAVTIVSAGLMVALSTTDEPASDARLDASQGVTSAPAVRDDRRIADASASCIGAWADKVAPGSRAGLVLSALRAFVDGDARDELVRQAILDLLVQAPEEAKQFYGVGECAVLVGLLWAQPPQAGGDAETPILGPCGQITCPDPPGAAAPAAPAAGRPDLRAVTLVAPTQVCGQRVRHHGRRTERGRRRGRVPGPVQRGRPGLRRGTAGPRRGR